MAVLVRLPQLGENITEGVVGCWRRKEGETVAVDEPLVEVITSKATFDVESPSAGILRCALAPEKSHIPVGYILAIIGAPDETLPEVAAENERVMAAFRAQALAEPEGSAAPRAAAVKATPGARRLAREANADLTRIPLPAGREILREEDVRAFLNGEVHHGVHGGHGERRELRTEDAL